MCKKDVKERYLVTGDTHGHFERIFRYIEQHDLEKNRNTTFIILGDAGINYYGWALDRELKELIESYGITFFCIHGNHERRPESIGTYKEKMWNNGKVYVEDEYPHILFAKDGEIYDIQGMKTLVLGGAYSIDRDYRIALNPHNPMWWRDEQPSPEIMERVENKLSQVDWNVDVVLSHTCPRNYEPMEAYLEGIDQNFIDKTTENWLQDIESKLTYEYWYAGHWHIEKKIEKMEFMYKNIHEFKVF